MILWQEIPICWWLRILMQFALGWINDVGFVVHAFGLYGVCITQPTRRLLTFWVFGVMWYFFLNVTQFLVSYSSCLNNWIVINYCLGSVKVSRLLILHKDLKSIATRECSFELPIRFCEFQMVNVDLLLLYIFNLWLYIFLSLI